MFEMVRRREKLNEFNSNNCKFKKATTLGFPEDCVVPFPETVGGRYSIWSPISLSAALENNLSIFLKGGSAADKMIYRQCKRRSTISKVY